MSTQTAVRKDRPKGTDANRDPLTGTSGAHPVGTSVGAAGGAATGAAIGTLAGPVGAGVGLVAGTIVGDLVGEGVAEKTDPTTEDACWKSNYSNRLFVGRDSDYAIYQSAYRMDFEVRAAKN